MKPLTQIPAPVLHILKTLTAAGYEAYIVGGCVRDSLLGISPKDWDIATNAKPEITKSLFEKTIDTGLKHGTVTVVIDHMNYEVTTYRIDGEYLDSRRPEAVYFTTSLKEDLSRRDFTVNAMAYHPEGGLADPFDGVHDLKNKVLRAVGDAEVRFTEDALRMMRGVRFSAQLDFEIEESTYAAILKLSSRIKNISCERIRDELTKTLLSDSPMKFILYRETGLLSHILPEVDVCFDTVQKNPYHLYNVGLHTLHAVRSIPKSPILRWAALLHDIGKPLTKTTDEKGIDHFYGHPLVSAKLTRAILKRLRFDNKSADIICRLVEHHDRRIEANEKAVRKAINAFGEDIFIDWLKLTEADARGQNPEYLQTRLEIFEKVRAIYEDIQSKAQCISLKNLALDGNDLIQIGIKPGKEIGILLKSLLDDVIENPELNTKEQLLSLIEVKKKE